MPAAMRESIARGLVPRLPGRLGRYARRSFLAMDRSPESMFFDNFAAIRLADQQRLLAPALRAAATRAGAYGLVARLLQRAERHEHAARSPALRRHQDLPGRAADEAGPDEHGGVDREPRAVPRSQAGRVRGDAARRVEAVRLDDQAHAARVDEGPAAGVDSQPAEDGVSRCRSRGWTRGPWNAVARDVLLDRRSRERGADRSRRRSSACSAITPPAAPTAATASGAC